MGDLLSHKEEEMSLQTDFNIYIYIWTSETVGGKVKKGGEMFGAVSQCLLKRKQSDLSCGKLD